MATIVINNDLRTMQIPTDVVLLGVESDDDVHKIQFQMPKEYCGFDLSEFEARINYMNAHGDGDVYIAEDLAVDGEDPTLMDFTWLVGRTACAYKGYTNFIVCLKKFDENQVVVQEFNTTVYQLPVLEGLETTEMVVQQNPDIIEYILVKIEESGMFDPDDYYTKTQVDGLIPTKLPNPYKLTINGNEYDGSSAVNVTITATSEVLDTVEGKIIHVVDAVPQEVESLKAYDSNNNELSSVSIAVANKNLFRSDLIADQVVNKGITFVKNEDGSVSASGTSLDDDAASSCTLDKNLFVVGKTYCLSTGKVLGFVKLNLHITYTDNSTEDVFAMNGVTVITISKEVASCVASILISESGTVVDDETIFPQIELSDSASAYVQNEYSSMTYDGTIMPELPANISNVWSNDDAVVKLVMQYQADTVLKKIDDYMTENYKGSPSAGGTLVSYYDGVGTVTLGLG